MSPQYSEYLPYEMIGAPQTSSDAEDPWIVVVIVHAAWIVRDLNFKYLSQGKGAPVTA